MNINVNQIIIFQDKQEFTFIKEKINVSLHNVRIVAWTPSAVEGCIQGGITFTTPADYEQETFYPPRFFSELRKLKGWCDALDSYLASEDPEIAQVKLRPFLNSILSIRIPFFIYRNEIDKLDAVIKGTKASKIIYFRYSENQYSLLSQLIDIIPAGHPWGVTFEAWEAKTKLNSYFNDNYFVKDPAIPFVSRRPWMSSIKTLLRRVKNRETLSFLSASWKIPLGRTRGVKNILILSADRHLRNLLDKVKKETDVRLFFFDDVVVDHQAVRLDFCQRVMVRMEHDSNMRTLMTYRNIDLSRLLLSLMHFVINQSVPQMKGIAQKFRELNAVFRFALVISAFEMTRWETIFDQCDEFGTPIFLMTHGGCLGLSAQHVQIPLCVRGREKSADIYYFVYGQKSADYCESLKQYFPEYLARHIPIGSVYFENLIGKNRADRSKGRAKEINILYVCGGVGIFNSTFKGGYYDDAGLYQLRHRILDLLKGQKGVNLYFKFGYDTEKLKLDLEESVIRGEWENVRYFPSKKRLVVCLVSMDLCFVEAPSSVLSEVLATRKPVVALIDRRGYVLNEDARVSLDKRMTIVRSMAEVDDCFKDILKNRFQARAFKGPDHKNDRFIRDYATCSDGRPAEKFAKLFEEVVNHGVSSRL